jgi:guanine deaminase
MDKKYMQMAIEEARRGIQAGDGGPFGAVIVKNGVIVGKGHNEVVKRNDPTCHGEIMAIHAACQTLGSFDLSGCELYTTGYPCPMCFGAILWANISQVYYGCTVKDTETIGFRDNAFYEKEKAGEDPRFIKELDRDACLALYAQYQQLDSKKNY